MSEPDQTRVWTVFDAALEYPDPEVQRQHVREVCAEEPALRDEVLSLLDAHREESLLDREELNVDVPASSSSPGEPDIGQLGPYEILEEIGRGGMGVVYRARDERLDRIVALKMLTGRLSREDKAKSRFVAEAQAAACLNHPNIATVHDIGEGPGGRIYFVMSYYEGQTLARRIQEDPLPIEEAREIGVAVARGLQRAHQAGIVHRDIKPSNILLVAEGGVRILDFGVAKIADLGLTRAGQALGTVAYMSPEQARGEEIDGRTDLWSLGVVCYEMLTGERPFTGEYRDAVIYAILHETPAPLRSLRDEVPRPLERVVETALAPDPSDRFDSAGKMAIALTDPPEPDTGFETRGGGTEPDLTSPERARPTVLAAQIRGYEDLLDRLVPEKVDAIASRVRDRTSRIMEDRGGRLHEASRESLLALFGAAAAHEDDFLRASRAGRALREAVGEIAQDLEEPAASQLTLSIGIDTGPAVVRSGEEPGSLEVSGQVLQIANELALRAGEDEILLSPDAARLVEPIFETRELEPAPFKGAGQTLAPHRLLEERDSETRIQAAEADLTPFAGRDRELQVLREALGRALAGTGRVVAVVGEAGLGKSRLLHEFREDLPEKVRQLSGRCRSRGGKIPYQPFADLLRSLLGLEDQSADSPAEELAETVRSIDERLERFLPYYAHLLSIETEQHVVPDHLEGEDLRSAMIEALAGIFTLASEEQPLALLMEDWHWSDEASRHVITQIADLASSYPMLVVLTYRPEYEGIDLGQDTLIQLEALSPEASASIIRSLAQVEKLPSDLAELIRARTGGNPFFLEEICQALIEEEILTREGGRLVSTQELRTGDLPDTVQSVLRTRLHRLGPQSRKVIRFAAVAGQVFSRVLLAKVIPEEIDLPAALKPARELGLIQQSAVVPRAEYRFKHALTREVVYESLLHHQRKRLHGGIGEAIEELFAESLEERLDVLAYHFSEAERWITAATYGRRAAQRALELSQHPQAAEMLESSLSWLREAPDEEARREELITALLEYERVCETLGRRDQQQEIIDELTDLLEAEEDPALLAEVRRRQGDLYVLRDHLPEASRALDSALELARSAEDRDVIGRTLRSIGFLRWHEEKPEEAIALNEQVLEMHRECGNRRALVGDITNIANILREEDSPEEAADYLKRGLELLDELDSPAQESYIYHHLGLNHSLLGETDQALEYLNRAIELADTEAGLSVRNPGLSVRNHYALMSKARLYLTELGDVDRSIELYQRAIDLARSSRQAEGLANALRVFGRVLMDLQRGEEALPYLEEATHWFAQIEDIESEAEIRARIGAIHEEQGRLDEAETAWQHIAGRLEELPPRFELDVVEAFGRIARERGDEPAALSRYYDAIELAGQLGEEKREARLRNVAGILEWNRGALEEALAQYEQALPLFREAGDPAGTGLMHNSMAACQKKLGRFEEALEHLGPALRAHERSGQDQMAAHTHALRGDTYLALGRMEEALEAFSASLELRWELEDREGEGWMMERLARVHAAREEPGRAEEYLQKARAIGEEIGDPELIEAGEKLPTEEA